MKRKLFTSKIKTILILAVALAIVTTVVVAVAAGTTPGRGVVGSILTPLRSAVAAVDRLFDFQCNRHLMPFRIPSRRARLRGLSSEGCRSRAFVPTCSTLQPAHSRKAWNVQSQLYSLNTSMQSAM